jgi:hypothetical protein
MGGLFSRESGPPFFVFFSMTHTGFLFTELNDLALTAGRSFDGLAVGAFRDMYGRAVEFKADELDEYLSNTLAGIEATKTESGELVGLPIDAKDHDKGDGAGWIVGAERNGRVIKLTPKWTEIGQELIGKGIRRFFSATVDTVNKVILGGTLTNWPATRDSKGNILLKPIELADNLYRLPEEKNVIDAALDFMRALFYQGVPATPDGQAPSISTATNGDEIMTVKLAELSAEERAELVKELAMQLQPQTQTPAPQHTAATPTLPVELAQVLGVQTLSEDGKAQLKTWMEIQAKSVQEQAQLAFNAEMARIQRENAVTELANRVTSGTAEAPRGIRGLKSEELKKHLLALPADEAKYFGELLSGIVKDGLVEFSELGHGRKLDGQTELPAEIAEKLDGGELNINDLRNPILGLGDMSAYNLSRWNGKEK